jgi:hypothetical protein
MYESLPIGNINDKETAIHDGIISSAGCIFAILA